MENAHYLCKHSARFLPARSFFCSLALGVGFGLVSWGPIVIAAFAIFVEIGPLILYAVEAGVVIALFFYGIRSRRRVNSFSSAPKPYTLDAESPAQPLPVGSEETPQKVIRLSPQPGPKRSTEMTQQQRIAAALAKAGAVTSDRSGTASKDEQSTPPDPA